MKMGLFAPEPDPPAARASRDCLVGAASWVFPIRAEVARGTEGGTVSRSSTDGSIQLIVLFAVGACDVVGAATREQLLPANESELKSFQIATRRCWGGMEGRQELFRSDPTTVTRHLLTRIRNLRSTPRSVELERDVATRARGGRYPAGVLHHTPTRDQGEDHSDGQLAGGILEGAGHGTREAGWARQRPRVALARLQGDPELYS